MCVRAEIFIYEVFSLKVMGNVRSCTLCGTARLMCGRDILTVMDFRLHFQMISAPARITDTNIWFQCPLYEIILRVFP